MMHGYGFDGWGMSGGGGLLTILFWVGVIALVLWGLKSLFTSERAPQHQPHPPLSPFDIAQARYARGDISRDEYLAIVADLQPVDNVHYPKEKRSEF